ncbi:MAG: hypothetical protein ACI9Y7_000456 [Dokdonia sp.]|jgi:hypothetical protein
MNEKDISEYIDKSLSNLKLKNLMFHPHPNMPIEMIDKKVEQKDDWIPWKAPSSNVKTKDIIELENKIELKYPKLYIEFLQYKHFYELENIAEISFFKHCSRDWKSELLEQYFDYWEPDEIINKGFIPFADYSDWGIVCLNTNKMHNNDCPIIMFDHETLYNEPVNFEELYPNFETIIKEFLNELNTE